jgi:hypothetical protein
MVSLSDISNRVPVSGIRVEKAEKSTSGLKGNKPETRGSLGQVEISQETAGPVSLCSRNELAYMTFTRVLQFH